MRPSLRPWFGIAGFYAATFAALAVWMQFLPVWLHEVRGLTKAQLTVVMSAQTLSRTVAGPLWSWQVDRSRRPRAVLRVLSLLSLAVFVLFGGVDSLLLLWLVCLLFGCFYSPMHPILDALTIEQAAARGFSFGRLRMVGSISFLVVILLAGWWLERAPADSVFVMLVGCLAATVAASMLLPTGVHGTHAAPVHAPTDVAAPPLTDATSSAVPLVEPTAARSVLRSRPFVLLLVSAALIQGSHAAFYTLSTVHWNEHGIGKGASAVLWAEAIVAEIVLFFVARHSVDRLRPTTVLMIGGLGAVLRWIVLASTTSYGWLLATNWLHALSFAATYLGSVRALDRRVPPQHRATAQGLLGAATSGVGMVIGALIGGFAYDLWGGRGFLTMAALALLGAGLAFVLRLKANQAQTAVHTDTDPRSA